MRNGGIHVAPDPVAERSAAHRAVKPVLAVPFEILGGAWCR